MRGHSQFGKEKSLACVANREAMANDGRESVEMGMDWDVIVWLIHVDPFEPDHITIVWRNTVQEYTIGKHVNLERLVGLDVFRELCWV